MSVFEQKFKKLPDKNFDVNSYATFCMNFVNSIKNHLDFKKIEDGDFITYEINIPIIKSSKLKISQHEEIMKDREKSRIICKGGI